MWPNRLLLDFSVVFIVLLSTCLQLANAYVESYTLWNRCGDLIDMEKQQLSMVRLRLIDQPVYRPHMSCSLALRAPPQHSIIMVVEWMDIDIGHVSGMCTDYLSVWNGELVNKTSNVEGLEPKVCGKEAPASVTSSGRSMTVHFDSNTVGAGAGFSLIFTTFHQGECKWEEFHCNNNRCIDKRLKCDDYNNCGDGSDACLLSISNIALALIVVTIIFSIIAAVVLLYCHRDKLFGRNKGTDSDGVYQPTTQLTQSTTTTTTSPDTAV